MLTVTSFEYMLLSEGEDLEMCYCSTCDDYFDKKDELPCGQTACPQCGEMMEEDDPDLDDNGVDDLDENDED